MMLTYSSSLGSQNKLESRRVQNPRDAIEASRNYICRAEILQSAEAIYAA